MIGNTKEETGTQWIILHRSKVLETLKRSTEKIITTDHIKVKLVSYKTIKLHNLQTGKLSGPMSERTTYKVHVKSYYILTTHITHQKKSST